MTHDPTFWIIARSSGLVAYGLLTASILVGLVLKARPFGKALKPAAVTDVHRFLAFLGLGALAVHGTSLVLDRTVDISPLALVLPGLITYRPVWTGLGVVAGELMVLVYASFSQRKRIGVKTWRTLHWLTYAIFALATVHGITAGTDTSRPWALPLYGSAVGAVLAATAWRALIPPAPAREQGRPRARGAELATAVQPLRAPARGSGGRAG